MCGLIVLPGPLWASYSTREWCSHRTGEAVAVISESSLSFPLGFRVQGLGRLAARRLKVTCRYGAPTHPGVWGGRHILRRRISRAQKTKNWCVGFSRPPPAYTGIHPTLYLFGFRANALNSHSSLICLALILAGLAAPPGASEGLSGGFGGLFVVWTWVW